MISAPSPDTPSSQRRVSRRALWGAIAWVAIISGIAFFWGLASTGLVDETEPLFAEAARQMYETGDWITPYFNGVPRFDKPPLVYWLMAIGFHLFGVGEWAVRLPSALSGAALVGMGFYTLQRFGFSRPEFAIAATETTDPALGEDPGQTLPRSSRQNLMWSALIGAALIALHPETLVWGRTGVSDMLLSGCMGTALFAFFLGYAQPEFPRRQRNWYLMSYGLAALAVLAKGPVGVVLPGLIILSFRTYLGQWRTMWRDMHLVKGAILFLAITVPWYVLVIAANGEAYIESFFGYHNFDRFTSVVNGHAAPWYFYFLVVAVGFLPWSPLLPWAIARLRPWAPRYWQRQPPRAHLGLFALTWFVVIFGFFTVAVTKLPSYVLPLMPAAAIVVALGWSDRMTPVPHSPKVGWGYGVSLGGNLVIFGVLAIAALYSPNWMGNDPAMPDLPNRVRESGIMLWAAVILGAALVSAIAALVMGRSRWLWSINLVAFVAFVVVSIVPAYQLADEVRQLPLRQIAATAVSEQAPGEALYMVGFMKPTLVFYTQQPVIYLESPRVLRAAVMASVANSALVVGTPEEIAAIAWPIEQQVPLLETPTYVLVRLMKSVS